MRGGAGQSRLIGRYKSTLAAVEDPITPPVSVKYNQLLINGQFVDAASGMNFFSSLIFSLEFYTINFFFLWVWTTEFHSEVEAASF